MEFLNASNYDQVGSENSFTRKRIIEAQLMDKDADIANCFGGTAVSPEVNIYACF
jgi:hypothetical protein